MHTAPPDPAGCRQGLLFVDHARLHDERHFRHELDVGQRVAGHGDEVGELARLDGAEVLLNPEELRPLECGGLDGLHGGHAGLDHIAEFLRVLAVWRHALVGAEGDLHSGRVGALEGRGHCRADQHRLGRDTRREKTRDLRLLHHENPGAERGHIVGAVFLHELDDLVGHERAVLDGVHAAEDCPLHALGPVRMDGHLQAVFVGGLDDRLDLLAGHLGPLRAVAEAEHATRRHDLYQVDPVFHVVAHGGERAVRAVEDFRLEKQTHDLVAVAVGPVGVAAGRPDGGARGVDPRTLDPTGGDRLAQCPGGIVAVAEVAHGGETGQQGLPGVKGRAQGVVARVEVKSLGITFRRLLAVEVDVHVHQARQDRRVLQVDDGVAGRRGGETIGEARQSVPFDGDGHGSAHLIGPTIDERAGVDQGLGVGESGGNQRHAGDKQKANRGGH